MKFQILTVALAVLGVAAADEAPRRRGLAKTGAKRTDASPIARRMAKRIKLRGPESEDDCDDDKKSKKSKDDPDDPAEEEDKKSKKDEKCSSSKDSKKNDDDDSSSTYHSVDNHDDRLFRGVCAEKEVDKDVKKEFCDECKPPHNKGGFCHWLNDDSSAPPLANDPSLYVYEAYDAQDFHEQVKEILELIEAEESGLASKTGGDGGGDNKKEKKEKKKKDENKSTKKDDKKDKKDKKDDKKDKKSKKKRKDDDDDSTSSSSSSGSADFFHDGLDYRGFRATKDMCIKPKKSRKEECKDIEKEICDKPDDHLDERFCNFVGLDGADFRTATGLRG